jgi:hypothetical protein
MHSKVDLTSSRAARKIISLRKAPFLVLQTFKNFANAYLPGKFNLLVLLPHTKATSVPTGPDWLHEVKYAGCRHMSGCRESRP